MDCILKEGWMVIAFFNYVSLLQKKSSVKNIENCLDFKIKYMDFEVYG